MPAQGGNAVQVTQGGGWEAHESPDGKLLYYIKDRRKPGLWSVPVAGGEERAGIVPNAWMAWWAVARDGVYFVDFTNKPPAIKQMRFGDGSVHTLRIVEKVFWDLSPWFTVTQDGRWVAWAQYDQLGSDIMLIDNFR